MTDERVDVVAMIVAATLHSREVDEIVNTWQPTDRELAAADRVINTELLHRLETTGAVQRPPSLLDMDLNDVRRLAWQGVALTRLLDAIEPRWAPDPDRPLSSIVMTLPLTTVQDLAGMLHRHGLTDLDDHLPD